MFTNASDDLDLVLAQLTKLVESGKIILEIVKKYKEKDPDTECEEEKNNKRRYVIVRTLHAGVFAGYLVKKDGAEVILSNARRIWKWDGAASLSQLAMEGTSLPAKCKFPCEIEIIELLGAIEILNVTEKARLNIAMVPIWKV